MIKKTLHHVINVLQITIKGRASHTIIENQSRKKCSIKALSYLREYMRCMVAQWIQEDKMYWTQNNQETPIYVHQRQPGPSWQLAFMQVWYVLY